ncbi:PLC-like phosphodiesterase [Pisolithus marmoratus]|nr:PLC-like phosphodiesterase [Pisolithus marmoratus]
MYFCKHRGTVSSVGSCRTESQTHRWVFYESSWHSSRRRNVLQGGRVESNEVLTFYIPVKSTCRRQWDTVEVGDFLYGTGSTGTVITHHGKGLQVVIEFCSEGNFSPTLGPKPASLLHPILVHHYTRVRQIEPILTLLWTLQTDRDSTSRERPVSVVVVVKRASLRTVGVLRLASPAELVESPQTLSPISSETTTNHHALVQQQSFQQIVRKASLADVPFPALLQQGIRMSKIVPRSQQSYISRLDVDQGQIVWESKRLRINTFQSWDITLRKPDAIRQRLKNGLADEEMRHIMWQANSQRSGILNFSEYEKFVKLLKARPELDRLYEELSLKDGGKLTCAVFEAFMRECEKACPVSYVLILCISSVTNWQGTARSRGTSAPSFKAVEASSTSVSIHLIALSDFLSVDIYDGVTEPVVYYGKTSTPAVPVRDVCEAISISAFITSPYPIIISPELHCSVAQQDMLVAIMHGVFGEALVSTPVGEQLKIDKLPSPEELRGRVLLKARNLHVMEQERIRTKGVVVDTELDISYEASEELRRAKTQNIQAIKATETSTAIARLLTKSNKQDTKVKMSAALVTLLVYTVGVKYRGAKEERYHPEHAFSLSETKANKAMKKDVVDLIRHATDHLVRIYPKGLRFGSTNYLQHRYWAAGARLVAFNCQICDLGCMINHTMFQRDGRAGYLLKPETLRLPDQSIGLCTI